MKRLTMGIQASVWVLSSQANPQISQLLQEQRRYNEPFPLAQFQGPILPTPVKQTGLWLSLPLGEAAAWLQGCSHWSQELSLIREPSDADSGKSQRGTKDYVNAKHGVPVPSHWYPSGEDAAKMVKPERPDSNVENRLLTLQLNTC